MKPPIFEYIAPESLDGALASLAQLGTAAKILAGGQSLVPLMNMRLAEPAVLIDINEVPGLDGLSAWDGGVSIGAGWSSGHSPPRYGGRQFGACRPGRGAAGRDAGPRGERG